VKGIRFLHDKKIIHRDMKSQNILLLKNEAEAKQHNSLVAKISDMGISKVVLQNNGNSTPGKHYHNANCSRIWE